MSTATEPGFREARAPEAGDDTDPGDYVLVTFLLCLPCSDGDHQTCYGERCGCPDSHADVS